MSRIRHVTRSSGFDALIALLVVVAVFELILGRDATDAPRTSLWITAPAVALMVLPLFARRRFPLLALTAYWLLAVMISVIDGQVFVFVESLFVVAVATAFALGNLRDPIQAQIGLGVTVAGAAVVVYNMPDHSTSELVFVPLLFGVSWLAGFSLRERADQAEEAELRAAQAEREREAAARIAVAEERVRIARELHDVVAHAVSVMVLQVGAVRHKLPEAQAEDREALSGVERAGRNALAEMRRLLSAMRSDDDDADLAPQPGLDMLGPLLEDVGRAGLPVQLHVEGERVPLPPAIDLSAYRIVQEGLTNALKHAHARRADVTLRYEPALLEIEIRDDGVGAGTSNGTGTGHGLVGVRERVKIYGGQMSAGSAPDGGFVLSTRLPLDVVMQ